MTNIEQARANFLELANGDQERAFDLAVMAYVEAWETASPGYRRDKPQASITVKHDYVKAPPVLVDGEA